MKHLSKFISCSCLQIGSQVNICNKVLRILDSVKDKLKIQILVELESQRLTSGEISLILKNT